MARLRHLMTDRDRAKSRRSRRRPRPGWYLWPATRPRSTAIRMNCGRHGFWPAMRASADRRRVTNVSPVWLKAQCASFSALLDCCIPILRFEEPECDGSGLRPSGADAVADSGDYQRFCSISYGGSSDRDCASWARPFGLRDILAAKNWTYLIAQAHRLDARLRGRLPDA